MEKFSYLNNMPKNQQCENCRLCYTVVQRTAVFLSYNNTHLTSTRKVKPICILLKQEQWVAVASTELYATLHRSFSVMQIACDSWTVFVQESRVNCTFYSALFLTGYMEGRDVMYRGVSVFLSVHQHTSETTNQTSPCWLWVWFSSGSTSCTTSVADSVMFHITSFLAHHMYS